jgi:teichuronic acid biosynthesis glycosyltransferase TuaC
LKILAVSSLFPNSVQERHGIFTRHRLTALAESEHVESITVLAPVPCFPSKSFSIGPYAPLTKIPTIERVGALKIHHPRYLNIPKIGMPLQPELMSRALITSTESLLRAGHRFDIVDAYYFYPDGVAAALLASRFDKPLVITAYGNDLSLIAANSRYAARRIRDSANQAGSNTAVCGALADALVDMDVPRSKVHVVLHGADLKLFRPPADRDTLRQQLGMDGWCLVCAGHLIERKGVHFAIQSLCDLPDVTLFIAGDGPEEQNLRSLARNLGVGSRVRFLGHVNQQQLRDYLGAADALVLMSSREGIANVIMESLACGTPVLATAIWGTPEIVCVPEAGRLIVERSADCLARTATEFLCAVPDRRLTRAYAEQFTWEKTTADHLVALRQALG